MREMDEMQEPLFTTVKLEDFVPADHPLRPVRLLVNGALKRLSGLFSVIYADGGHASIAPEKLLRALVLQVFYSVRSEGMLMEQMRYDLLFRWVVGLAIEDAEWDHSVLSKNRNRLLEYEVVETFFTEVMSLADRQGLLSCEHFLVGGTLIQACASHKSFRPKDGPHDPPAGGGRNADTGWTGRRRTNDTHESGIDPDASLFKKSSGSPTILCYHGHVLMEDRSGPVVGAVVSHADSFAERASALRLLDCVPGRHAKTLGADNAYDTRDFVPDCRARKVTPHAARHDERWGGSAIDSRTSRHAGYGISQIKRKRIEEHFGGGKTIGKIRQTVYRGINGWTSTSN